MTGAIAGEVPGPRRAGILVRAAVSGERNRITSRRDQPGRPALPAAPRSDREEAQLSARGMVRAAIRVIARQADERPCGVISGSVKAKVEPIPT